MSKSKQEPQDHMCHNIDAAIRRTLFWRGGSLSRHAVVEARASGLSAQRELIRADARKQRPD